MDRDFADWYREASVEPHDETLGKRWQGVEAFAGNLGFDETCELSRLFHGLAPCRLDVIETFRVAFQTVDSAFAMKDNDLELAILAGATLTQVTALRNTEIADFAALAVACPDFQHLSRRTTVPGIVGRMRAHLSQRSLELRSSTPLNAAQLPTTSPQHLIDDLKEKCTGGALNPLAEPLEAAFASLNNRVDTISAATNLTQYHQSLYREDSEVLWWLIGEHSRDLAAPMCQIKYPAVCLVAGKELADLIFNLPGPYAAPAVLHSVLCKIEVDLTKPVSLSQAVNDADRSWRHQWIEKHKDSDVADLCPTMFAVAKSLEATSQRAWPPVFQSAMGMTAGTKIPPVALATQVYEESLLHKAIQAKEE